MRLKNYFFCSLLALGLSSQVCATYTTVCNAHGRKGSGELKRGKQTTEPPRCVSMTKKRLFAEDAFHDAVDALFEGICGDKETLTITDKNKRSFSNIIDKQTSLRLDYEGLVTKPEGHANIQLQYGKGTGNKSSGGCHASLMIPLNVAISRENFITALQNAASEGNQICIHDGEAPKEEKENVPEKKKKKKK